MPASTFRPGTIDGVLVRTLEKWTDHRGWLCEVFRRDELPENLNPAMGYVSMTEPGVLRGPHEHREQTDCFCFIGPGPFRVYLWDNRPDSPTFGIYQEEKLAGRRPTCLVVPAGVVHGYLNVGKVASLVLNLPNRLYRGTGKNEPVDEIRHEADPFSPFKVALQPRRRKTYGDRTRATG